MNKVLFIIAVVIIAVSGYFVWQKQHQASACFVGGTQCAQISGWITSTDAQQGISFQYPETLSTTYIATQDWPPVIKLVSGISQCAVEPFTINGRSYCVKAQTEGAAGSIYTSYAYAVAVPRIDKTVEMSFTLRFPQCANYDEPKKSACETERTSLNLDDLVDKMFSTIQQTVLLDVQ